MTSSVVFYSFVSLAKGTRRQTWLGPKLDQGVLFSFFINKKLVLLRLWYDSGFIMAFSRVQDMTLEGGETLRERGLGDRPNSLCCAFLTTRVFDRRAPLSIFSPLLTILSFSSGNCLFSSSPYGKGCFIQSEWWESQKLRRFCWFLLHHRSKWARIGSFYPVGVMRMSKIA